MAVKLLKPAVRDIVKISDHQLLNEAVELVTKEISEYKDESKLVILEKLKHLCIKEKMATEMAKMYRNIGMYHFHANDFDKAIISMQLAVDILYRDNCIKLLIEYCSELGLVYFYNKDYLYAKRYYEEAEKLLLEAPDTDKQTIYLHYCRYGVLLSNMQDYEPSRLKLEKALSYAEDEKDIGLAIMNIGLLYKRQKDLKSALKHYSKALYLLNHKDLKTKGIVYNNIAEVYKILGQYRKALKYIDKAFKCIMDNDLSRTFVYFNTYTEIKILMGEREAVLDDFLDLLGRVKDFHLYKSVIIEGISNMIVIGSEDENILKRLEAAIIELIADSIYVNEEYAKDLRICLGNIRVCLEELEN